MKKDLKKFKLLRLLILTLPPSELEIFNSPHYPSWLLLYRFWSDRSVFHTLYYVLVPVFLLSLSLLVDSLVHLLPPHSFLSLFFQLLTFLLLWLSSGGILLLLLLFLRAFLSLWSKVQLFLSRKDNYDRPKDALNPAVKLPLIAYCLDQDRQGELIEMREIWYGDRPLNIWTHMSVGLKTQQYLIYDHFWFWLRQKVEDRWQPMNRERLPRIKNSD